MPNAKTLPLWDRISNRLKGRPANHVPITPAQAAELHAKMFAESFTEDRLFDEYWDLPDRPRPKRMMAVAPCTISATGKPEPMREAEDFDYEHWRAWVAARKGKP